MQTYTVVGNHASIGVPHVPDARDPPTRMHRRAVGRPRPHGRSIEPARPGKATFRGDVMNANVTGRPETAPTVAAPADAPGTNAGDDHATAKIVGNDCDISRVCKAPGVAGGQDGGRGSGTWAGGNLATGGDAGTPRAANGYKLVSENLTVSKMPRCTRIVAPCYRVIFQTGTDIARLCAA